LFIVHHNIIAGYDLRGQTLTALHKAEEAYAEAKALQENFLMARTLAAMGRIYHSMMQNDEAMRCFSESLELALQKREEGTAFYIENYYYLASIAGFMNHIPEVLQYADSMIVEIELLQKTYHGNGLRFYNFVASAFQAPGFAMLGQKEQAQEALRRAETFFDPQWQDSYYVVILYTMYSKYYLAMGDYDRAIEYSLLKIRFYEDNNLPIELDDDDLAKAYAGKGNLLAAIEAYRQIIQRKDEHSRERFYAQINELRAIYQLDKAELEAERRQATIRQQRLIITGLLIAAIALMVIAAIILRSRRRIARKNSELYRKINEQDFLEKELSNERVKNRKLQMLLTPPKPEALQSSNKSELSEKETEDKIYERISSLTRERKFYTNPDVRRKEVAETIGVSEKDLQQCLKNNTGMSFVEYINHQRLIYVRELLASKDRKLTVEAIVLDAGFGTRSNFYRLFREKYGMTPEEFRKIALRQ
jgi:AraC-like DNA-binding protein